MDGTSNRSDTNVEVLRKIILATVWIAIALARATAQCPGDPQDWISELSQIENSDSSLTKKIAELQTLESRHRNCTKKNDSISARLLHRLGDLCRLNGDFEKGIELTSAAAAINKTSDPGASHSYLTHSYYNLGLFHLLLGLNRNAHLYFDSCVTVGTQYTKKVFIALMALEKKAFISFQTGDYEQSIRSSDYGITIARQHNLYDYEVLLLIQKAQAESGLLRVDEASATIRKAMAIISEHHLDSWLPNAYSVYAHLLGVKKDFGNAIAHYKMAYNLNMSQGNTAQAARDLNDLALLYDKEINNPDSAIYNYQKVLVIAKSVGDPSLLSMTCNNIGQVYWHKGEYQSSLKYYQLGLTASINSFNDTITFENPSGRALQSVGNAYIPSALLWNKGDAFLGLYRMTHNTDDLSTAIAAYRMGDRMVDQMRWSQQGEQSKLFWRERTKQWYKSAVEASFLLDDPASVFYFMEKSRAVLLNDKLSELGATEQLPADEAKMERRLRLQLQGAESDEGAVWNARTQLHNFIRTLERKYPAYYAYKYDTAVATLQTLQQHLSKTGQTWVELFTSDTTIYILTVTDQTAKLKSVSFYGHRDVAGEISRLCSHEGLINKNYPRFRELSHRYYETLFEPLQVRSQRVVVSQDDYFLPFDLLITDVGDDGAFLVRKHAFTYAYSASHHLRHQTTHDVADRSLLAIAPVDYSTPLKLPPLSGSDASLDRIGSVFGGSLTLTKSTATKNQFVRNAHDFDVIHFYSHAMADTLGNEPVIYFYDSALHLSELRNLPDLKTRLVLLFACNSGVGKSIKGEGILSLARGFAAAGIPSTISAMWEIDSRTTYSIAELFFSNLASGLPSDVALQQAKLEFVDTGDQQHQLPYFWAAPVLIGKAETHDRGGIKSLTGLGIVAILLLAILIFRTNRSEKKSPSLNER